MTHLQTAPPSVLAADLRTVVGRLIRRLREEGSLGDFTESQKAVMSRLERDGPASVADLARSAGMRSQSMATIVAALTEAGMVQGAPDPTDGRRIILSLTDSAIARVHASRSAREDWLFRTLSDRLTTAEQEQLADSVALLGKLLGP